MTPLIVRLALSGIRARIPASVLTLLVTGAAAATIVIALSIGSTIADPWQQTFAAANGAHIQASVPTNADAVRIAQMPGVSQADDPVPVAQATLIVDGEPTRVIVVGLSGHERVNVPLITSGTEPADGSILLERSLAQAIHVNAPTDLALQGSSGMIPLTFAGEAISPSQARYPRSNPGLVWVTRATFEQIAPDRSSWRWNENLRLSDPASAPAFAANAASAFPSGTVSVEPWQQMQSTALQETQPFQVILIGYTALLLVVSAAVIGIVIGARAANQAREIGIFKTIGFTPRQIASVYTFEVLLLALSGTLLGFIPGFMIAPLLARASASTLLTAPEQTVSLDRLVIAAAIVLPVAGLAAYRSARRSANGSVADALRSASTPLRPASRLGRLASLPILPVPAMLGLRDLAARRRRLVWLLLVILLTGSALVATICAQAAIDKATAGGVTDIPGELPTLIYSLDGVLAISASSALVAVALLMVRERVRDIGILRTIGLAPGQVVATVAGTLAAVALVAGLLAIPAGLGLYALLYLAAGGDGGNNLPPWWALASAPFLLVAATLIATAIPARLSLRLPIAQAIRQDR
jgi:putative ABC transport system permease protein